jgi:16S rRNA (cytosine967-C5)-methyltransferase
VSDRDPVGPARRAAFEVLRRTFEHDAWADRAFPAAAERHDLGGRDRARAQRLAYGAVQRRGTTDALIERLSGRSPARLDPPVVAALRLGLFELLFSAAPADHAAVGAAVELAKGGMRRGGARRAAGAAGLVNAVLRRAAREREPLHASLTDENPEAAAVAHSAPPWLAEMWWEELGVGSARSLLRAINEPPETALRVNTLRADRDELLGWLLEAGEPVRDGPATAGLALPHALVWDGPLGDGARAALGDGRLFAQSRGAQAVVAILDPHPGERVLDLCAGPGVKTTAIAARLAGDGELVAVERDAGRARQIEELCERAGAGNVRVEVADAKADAVGRGYDRVLVDPPCSDLGTLASRPDARWRKDPGAIERLAAEQEAVLARGLEAVRPGGTLVYSTCTISRRENRDVIGASGVAAERWSTVETRPDRDRTDGFFIASTHGSTAA